jgi:hypothetical protein
MNGSAISTTHRRLIHPAVQSISARPGPRYRALRVAARTGLHRSIELQSPTGQEQTMSKHRRTAKTVPNIPPAANSATSARSATSATSDDFDPADALESLHAEIIQLEAFAHLHTRRSNRDHDDLDP